MIPERRINSPTAILVVVVEYFVVSDVIQSGILLYGFVQGW